MPLKDAAEGLTFQNTLVMKEDVCCVILPFKCKHLHLHRQAKNKERAFCLAVSPYRVSSPTFEKYKVWFGTSVAKTSSVMERRLMPR